MFLLTGGVIRYSDFIAIWMPKGTANFTKNVNWWQMDTLIFQNCATQPWLSTHNTISHQNKEPIKGMIKYPKRMSEKEDDDGGFDMVGTVSQRRHHGLAALAPHPRIHLMCVGRRWRCGSTVLWKLGCFGEIKVVHHRGILIAIKMKKKHNEISNGGDWRLWSVNEDEVLTLVL